MGARKPRSRSESRRERMQRGSVTHLHAVYACGHRVELHPRGDAETECWCARHAPLMGLVARAA